MMEEGLIGQGHLIQVRRYPRATVVDLNHIIILIVGKQETWLCILTQSAFTCSKLTIAIPEQAVKHVQK